MPDYNHTLQFDESTPIAPLPMSMAALCITNVVIICFFLTVFPLLRVWDWWLYRRTKC
jgi:hypothetical protein